MKSLLSVITSAASIGATEVVDNTDLITQTVVDATQVVPTDLSVSEIVKCIAQLAILITAIITNRRIAKQNKQ